MMKKITLLLLFLPFFSSAQKLIETVKLKNNKFAALYDDGTWVYTTNVNNTSTYNALTDNTAKKRVTSTTKASSYGRQSTRSVSSYSSTCGARTKKGGSCRRTVSGGGRCWQH